MSEKEHALPWPQALIDRAEELFLFEGLEYFEIARQTGIPKKALWQMADEGKWEERRQEFGHAEKVLLLKKLYGRALKKPEAQTIYALERLERLLMEQREKEATGSVLLRRYEEIKAIESRADAAEVLKMAVEKRIHEIAESGHVDTKIIKELDASMEMIERMANKGVDLPKIFLQNIEFIGTVLAGKDPDAVEALARNYDFLIAEFKKKNAQD